MRKFWVAVIGLGLILVVYFILYDFFVLGYGSAAIRARQMQCFSSQREIQSAVSLFDLDAKDQTGEIKKHDLERLVQEKYLKSSPVCPMEGEYQLKQTSEGIITSCNFHGTEDQKGSGRLDPGHGLFFWIRDWAGTTFKNQ